MQARGDLGAPSLATEGVASAAKWRAPGVRIIGTASRVDYPESVAIVPQYLSLDQYPRWPTSRERSICWAVQSSVVWLMPPLRPINTEQNGFDHTTSKRPSPSWLML